MQQPKKVYHISCLNIAILASITGIMAINDQSFATDNKQQTATLQNSMKNISVNRNIVEINHKNQQIYANQNNQVSLQTNMVYREARILIMQQGWRPNLQGEQPNLRSPVVKELFDLGYQEIKDCAGSGEGACRFEFVNDEGELLVVTAITRGYENKIRFVKKWWIEKNSNIIQQSSTPKIADGYYALGGTGQGLEVKGKQYRYYDEEGKQSWQSINDLKYIKNGVLSARQNYWCLSTLAPQGKPAVCSENGWKTPEILPFIGTRYYNFLGGSGTGQTITIKDDGNAIVKIIGTQNTSVIYEGKFTNPLIFVEGDGILIKDNKIYLLGRNRKFAKGCKGEGIVCESELYEP
ncbi:hypothetical protein WJM97_03015 [Okeanomitos corallinicola TIOX110]|uniref:Uncharacterized protein n=1 Tax=Okeanomitos corallinicola TIOX110 TaxID=3133117 RepID=A0ABZ2UUL9_9CYAN